MARRGKYHDWVTEEGLLKIEGWARDGLTDKQIAEHKIGVNESTLHRWKKTQPQVMQALKRGKEVVDRQVENALLKNALGFEYEETKTYITVNPDGTKSQRVEKTKKVQRPDTTAGIFWLKNRKPAEWRDKQQIEHSGNLDVSTRISAIKEYLESDEL